MKKYSLSVQTKLQQRQDVRFKAETPWFRPSLKKSVLVAQSFLTLCDPLDCSPPGFSVHGILHARILEWVAILFSWGSFRASD